MTKEKVSQVWATITLLIIVTLRATSIASATAVVIVTGGLNISLYPTGTISSLTIARERRAALDAKSNFSFVPKSPPRRGCHNLGDITIRVRRLRQKESSYSYFSSASADGTAAATPLPIGGSLLAAHDISALLNETRAAGNGQNNDPNGFGGRFVPVSRYR